MKTSFIIILIIIFNIPIFSQEEDVLTRYKDKSRRVYWFDLALKTKADPDTQLPQYYVYPTSKVKYGSAEDFERYLWNNIAMGTYLSIGPFDTYQQAELSYKLYDPKVFNKDSNLVNTNTTYYYYIINLKKRTRLKSFDFERLPAAVAPGRPRDFVTLIQASIKLDRLVIGAFATMPEAENSKRVFRLQE